MILSHDCPHKLNSRGAREIVNYNRTRLYEKGGVKREEHACPCCGEIVMVTHVESLGPDTVVEDWRVRHI